MAWTFCTSGAAIAKAGNSVSSTIKASGATLAEWSEQVEHSINQETKYDWTTNYASVGSNFVEALSEIASSLIGNKLIGWDMSGYTSRFEAITMININHDIAQSGIKVLKDKDVQAL